MNTKINDSMDSVKDIVSSAKEGTEHAVASTRSVVLDGIRMVGGVVSILRGFGVGDALGWFGLARRRSGLSTVASFGAGMFVGTGVGMLFAPRSGADTRQAIKNTVIGLLSDAGRTVAKAEASIEGGAKQVGAKVEDLASKAKTAAVRVEHDIAAAVTERADPPKEPARVAPDPGNHRPTPPSR